MTQKLTLKEWFKLQHSQF